VFWYLYVLLDEWSRKVIAWRVSHTLCHEQADRIMAERKNTERKKQLTAQHQQRKRYWLSQPQIGDGL